MRWSLFGRHFLCSSRVLRSFVFWPVVTTWPAQTIGNGPKSMQWTITSVTHSMVKTDYIEIAAIRDECAQQLLIDLVFVLLCFFSLPFFFCCCLSLFCLGQSNHRCETGFYCWRRSREKERSDRCFLQEFRRTAIQKPGKAVGRQWHRLHHRQSSNYHHPSVSAALCCAWIIIRL